MAIKTKIGPFKVLLILSLLIFISTNTHSQDNTFPVNGFSGIGTQFSVTPQKPLHLLGTVSPSVINEPFIRFSWKPAELSETYISHIGVLTPRSGVPAYSMLSPLYANTGDYLIQASETAEDLILTTRNHMGSIRLATTPANGAPDMQRFVLKPNGRVGLSTNNPKGLLDLNYGMFGVGVEEVLFPRIIFHTYKDTTSSKFNNSPSMWLIKGSGAAAGTGDCSSDPDKFPVYPWQITLQSINEDAEYSTLGALNFRTSDGKYCVSETSELDPNDLITKFSFLRSGKLGINHNLPKAELHVLGKASINDPATNEIITGTHSDYRLAVEGKIVAKEIIVTIDNWDDWPDYVFKPNYNLMPLAELEQSINTNGHLPGMPSANDIKENGINVTEVQTKMLEKIEELTLYMIELKKENEVLKQEINKLK